MKICGLMRPEDAAMAASAGADAVGIICHPAARRYVLPEVAREIIAAAGPLVTPVAVFVDQSADEIRRLADALGIRTVQLNGRQRPAHGAELARHGLCVIRAVHVRRGWTGQIAAWRNVAAAVVLETAAGRSAGGSGVPNDFAAIARAVGRGRVAPGARLVVAGGLAPENVADVVRTTRPWAVDVSTGVESALGCKSAEKIRAFMAAVQGADAERLPAAGRKEDIA